MGTGSEPAGMSEDRRVLRLMLEVSGCPVSCLHCASQGRHYRPMLLADLERTLAAARGFCARERLTLEAFPLHEVMAHPDAPRVLALFAELPHEPSQPFFHPLATDAVPLATRGDWERLLDGARAVGTTTFWMALHGLERTHDQIVSRAGAYQSVRTAVERVRAAGSRCGCNVFLTRDNVPDFRAIVDLLRSMEFDETCWMVATYSPTAHGRRYEHLRAEASDLAPLVEKVLSVSPLHRDVWSDLARHTEAHYCSQAVRGELNYSAGSHLTAGGRIPLVCRSNLDLHSGDGGLYGPYHGNLREQDPLDVFARAVRYGPVSEDTLRYDVTAFPAVAQLARQVGAASGSKVHVSARSVRLLWLDRALAGQRRC